MHIHCRGKEEDGERRMHYLIKNTSSYINPTSQFVQMFRFTSAQQLRLLTIAACLGKGKTIYIAF